MVTIPRSETRCVGTAILARPGGCPMRSRLLVSDLTATRSDRLARRAFPAATASTAALIPAGCSAGGDPARRSGLADRWGRVSECDSWEQRGVRQQQIRGGRVARVRSLTDQGLHQRFPVSPLSPRSARQLLRRWLDTQGWPPEQAADLVLAASEAVTNSVEHAYPEAARESTVSLEGQVVAEGGVRRVVLTVSDGGQWRPRPASTGFRGRGMMVIRAMTQSVEFSRTPHGTRVTMTSTPVSETSSGRH
jgi:anti-sigma regulatory factor (Ser/Thr protein kinase)